MLTQQRIDHGDAVFHQHKPLLREAYSRIDAVYLCADVVQFDARGVEALCQFRQRRDVAGCALDKLARFGERRSDTQALVRGAQQLQRAGEIRFDLLSVRELLLLFFELFKLALAQGGLVQLLELCAGVIAFGREAREAVAGGGQLGADCLQALPASRRFAAQAAQAREVIQQ